MKSLICQQHLNQMTECEGQCGSRHSKTRLSMARRTRMLSFASSIRQWKNGRAWAPLLLHCDSYLQRAEIGGASNLRCREVIEMCGIQCSVCVVTSLRLPAAKHLLSSCCVPHSANSYLDKESKAKESHYHACLTVLATPNK